MAGRPFNYLKKKRRRESRIFVERSMLKNPRQKSGAASHVLSFARGAAVKQTFESPELPLAALKPRCRPAGARSRCATSRRESGIIDLKSRIHTTTHQVPDPPSAASPHHDCPASRNDGAAPRYAVLSIGTDLIPSNRHNGACRGGRRNCWANANFTATQQWPVSRMPSSPPT